MNDLSQTIAAKSDQLNADDLIGGSRTIKVTRVVINKGAEQPAWIYFEGDNNKPYKPGLSMRRMLVHVWGNDTAQYVGRRMTLYRDGAVRFGGLDVGGIRISHMSDITAPVTRALTEKKGSKKAFTVKPLAAEQHQPAGRSGGPGQRSGEQSRSSANRDRAKSPTGSGMSENSWNLLCGDAREAASKGSDALRRFREDLHPDHDRALDAIAGELDVLSRRADDGDSFPGDEPHDRLETEHA